MDLGHWKTNLKIEGLTSLPYGFIYVITNTINGKKYFGKKQMKSVKKLKPLKGRKNKRHFDIETDWKSYTSSSNELNADLLKYGKEKFNFEILRFCDSKFELAYYEAKIQFENDVLLKDGFYNGIINCRIGRAPTALLQKTVDLDQTRTTLNLDTQKNESTGTKVQSLSN